MNEQSDASDAGDASDDWLTGPTWTRPARDKFLLSIIDAYPDWDGEVERERRREQRLDDAKRALFLEPVPEGPKRAHDNLALYFMAQQYLADLSLANEPKLNPAAFPDKPRKPRSIRVLATEAARFATANSSASAAERLRKTFIAKKKYWMNLATYHDDVRDSIEYQILLKLKALLSRLDLKMDVETAARS